MPGLEFATRGSAAHPVIIIINSDVLISAHPAFNSHYFMRRPNPQSESNIRRIDTKKRAKKQTHGFQVHFIRGTQAVTKMFSDSVYGGKEAARRAARKFKRSAMAGLTRLALVSKPKKSARRPAGRKTKRRRR
ncbi:MAG: hypothetical protein QOG67_1170 [Verrucomicrobiota bacterium]|jgi:hypothetical protein